MVVAKQAAGLLPEERLPQGLELLSFGSVRWFNLRIQQVKPHVFAEAASRARSTPGQLLPV